MKVWAVFNVVGDGDGYAVFDLIGIGETSAAAQAIADERLLQLGETPVNPVHPTMSASNRYTFVGPRSACRPSVDHHGGFVIEEIECRS